MTYQVILAGLRDMFCGDDCPEMDELLGQAIMECGVPSFKSVSILKDKGNTFFQMGVVPLAFFHYRIALKFLLLMGTPASYDESSATSLAISIFLNLAACDLKTPDYDQVCWYCSLILLVDPSNAKALYRRGLAFKHLNLLPKAVADFESALKFSPHNKDISRELQDVVDRLAINLNGKRESSPTVPLDIERKGKKPLLSPASFVDCVPASLPEVTMDSESSLVPCEAMDEIAYSANSRSSHFRFTNKKKPHNNLHLSSQDYENLMQGKNLEFFHPRSMSTMRVRPLISKTIQTGTPLEDISGPAEVPISSPMSENPHPTFDVKQESDTLVQEDFIFQVDKKKRLSSESSHVSKVSMTTFKFAAVRNHFDSKWSRNEGFSHGSGRKGLAFTISKKRSFVSVNVSTSFCRFPQSTKMVTRTKRKDIQSIEFDTHYHPPFKKSRIFSSVTTSCTFSSVILGCSGVSNPPLFVFE